MLPLHCYHHTHWDREWYAPFRTYQVRLARVVDTILDQLESGQLPCFMLDGQTAILDDYLALRPQHQERLKTLIQANKLSIGPWFVAPDTFLVSGESLIENLKLGIQTATHWGSHSFCGYLPDTFGHPADLPLVFQHFGIETALLWRGVAEATDTFWWQHPSGRKVLVYTLVDGYFQMMFHDETLTAEQKQAAFGVWYQKATAANQTGMVLFPIGGDHLGPLNKADLNTLEQTLPKHLVTTPEVFMKSLQQYVTTSSPLPSLTGTLLDNQNSFVLQGVWSARLYLKQQNRRLEHYLTRVLEPLLALRQVLLPVTQYPQPELALAWKLLLLNHPHDSICGCSVDAVHRENETRFEEVYALCEPLYDAAVQDLIQHTATVTHPMVAVNLSETPYTGVLPATTLGPVLDAFAETPVKNTPALLSFPQVLSEQPVLSQNYKTNPQTVPLSHLTQQQQTGCIWVENLPPFSVVSLSAADCQKQPPVAVTVTARTLENSKIACSVELDGTLTLTCKQTGRVFNKQHVLGVQPDTGDSYNSAPCGSPQAAATLVDCQPLLSGSLQGALQLTYQLLGETNPVVTTLYLNAESAMLVFKTTWHNSLPTHKVTVGFQATHSIQTVLAEGHFGVTPWVFDPNYQLSQHMPAEKGKELKTNTGPIQRFIRVEDQLLLTEGLTEYTVDQNNLLLTLLRGFNQLSKADTGVRGAQAGPPFETPEGSCLNRLITCRYAWQPVQPSEETTWQAMAYQQAALFYGHTVFGYHNSSLKLSATPLKKTAPLVQWHSPAVTASRVAWQPALNALTLRLLNLSETSQSIQIQPGLPSSIALETNFLNVEETRHPVTPKGVAVSIPARDVKTVCIQQG